MNSLKTSLEMWCDGNKKSCKSYVTLMWTLLQIQQGQLISNGLLGTLNSSKNELKNRPNYYDTSGRIVFVRFLEELKTPKRH